MITISEGLSQQCEHFDEIDAPESSDKTGVSNRRYGVGMAIPICSLERLQRSSLETHGSLVMSIVRIFYSARKPRAYALALVILAIFVVDERFTVTKCRLRFRPESPGVGR